MAVLVAGLGESAPGQALASFHQAWTPIAIAACACALVSLALGPLALGRRTPVSA